MREKAWAKKKSSQAAKVKRILRVSCNLEGKTSYSRHSLWLPQEKNIVPSLKSHLKASLALDSFVTIEMLQSIENQKRTLSHPISLHLLRKTNWSHKLRTHASASLHRTLRENLLNVLITEPLKQDSIITQNKSIIITRGRQESETA